VRVAPANLTARIAALRNMRFGSLGFSPGAGAVVGKAGGAVAGGEVTALATAAGYGAMAGPIGAVAAVVIALAISLFTKKYFNVSQANQFCQTQVTLWQKYLQLQGYVAGRALSWPTMVQIFHGAVGAGMFPGNDQHLKFHEGTLACAGDGSWVDQNLCQTTDQMGGHVAPTSAHNAICDALTTYNQSRSRVPPGYPDAVYFVDNVWLPMWASAKIPWFANGARNSQVHQMLYDLVDAYLAQNASGTTPYVQYPQSQVGTATAGAVGAPQRALTAPSQLVPAQTQVTPSSQNMLAPSIYNPAPGGSVVAGAAAGGNALPGTTPYYITPGGGISMTPTPGSRPVVPAGYTGAVTTGGNVVSNPIFLYLGGGLLVTAAVMMGLKHGKKGRRS
jgi:hypothetical protein